jgi:SEL1 protein
MNQVCAKPFPLIPPTLTNLNPAPKKDWSLSEWIANFIDDEMRYYEQAYEEDYEDTMPGGDGGIAGDLGEDDGILESLVIVGLAAALVFLLMYRQQRQAQARRQEEENARRQQVQQQQPAAGNDNPPAVQEQGQGQQQQQQPEGNGLQGWEWIAGPGGFAH